MRYDKARNIILDMFIFFWSKYYILNDREHLGKSDSKSDEGVFLGYSNNNRVYRVYNMRTLTIMEYASVVVDNFNDFADFSKEKEISSFIDEAIKDSGAVQDVATKANDVAILT